VLGGVYELKGAASGGETDYPHCADRRDFYKGEKWSKDGKPRDACLPIYRATLDR
jgi:hypothetical protein